MPYASTAVPAGSRFGHWAARASLIGMLGLAVVALAPAPAAVSALPPQCSAPDVNNMVTCTYTDQGSTEYTLPIPAGTTSAQIRAVGQQGGSSPSPAGGDPVPGGRGALVTATITSIPTGSSFKIRARADGGSSPQGAGGGSAAVRFGLSGSETDLLIAAGGGGAGGGAGGNAGAPGQDGPGDGVFLPSGGGGGQTATTSTNGAGGSGVSCGAFGGEGGQGGAGTTTGGGVGGTGGVSGSLAGGGGGGGQRGGGGGGGGCSYGTPEFSGFADGGGGAGGLSLVPSGGSSALAPVGEQRNVRITFQVTPVMAVTPTSMAFGNVRVGSTSAAQTVTVSNPGGAPFTVTSTTITGNPGFQSSGCIGVVVQPGASCSLSVTFAPTTSGSSTGTLFVNTTAPNSPRTVLLTGTGVTPIASLSPSTLAFPATVVGQQSPSQTVTMQNTGPVSMSITNASLSGANAADFVETSDSCTGAVLNTGQSCNVQVAFKPLVSGSRSATLSFTDNAPGSPHQVTLSGAATQPAASLTPSSLTFPDTAVGQTSPQQVVTLRNVGTATLSVSGVTLGGSAPGDYQMASDCTGATLAPNATCFARVSFRPTVAGTRPATLVFADNAPGSPHSVSLTGRGLSPQATLTPTSVSFGTQGTGTESASRPVVLRNIGDAPMVVSAVAVVGTHSSEFPILDQNCAGATIAVGETCTVRLAFAPTAPGSRTANLRFTDNAPGSPHLVPLTGVGSPPVVSVPANQSFGDVPVGTTGAPQEVVITNTGLGVLEVPSITVVGAHPGDFTVDPTNPCEGSIDPGDSCAVPISFRPGAAGARTATLRITDNATGSPHQVSLTGSGTATARMDLRGPGSVYTTGNGTKVTLAVTGPNVTATYRVKVTNTGTAAATYEFNLAKSGSPATAGIFTTGNVALPTNGLGNQFTASIAPGKFIEYLVKVTPTSPGQNISTVAIRLLASNGAVQDNGILETNVAAPAKGVDGYGLFATSTGQPYIGGSVNGQSVTATTVALNGSAAFTVRLRNDGTNAHPVTLKLTGATENCWTRKATVGGVDITAAAYGSGYATPSMAVGTQKDVVVTIKRVLNGCGPLTHTATSFNGTTAMHFSRLIANPTVPAPPNTTPSLQVYGPGSAYTAFGNTVTKPVTAAGVDAVYTLRVVNTTVNPSSFKIALTKAGAPSNARVFLGSTVLPQDANGDYITPTIPTNGTGQYQLRVATTAAGRTTGVVMATLVGASGPMSTLTTETNVQAPATGSDAYGLYVKEGSQAFVGMLPAVQAATAPSLPLNGTAKFTVRLRNDSAAASSTRLRLSGPGSACFTATAALGTVNVTAQAFSSSGYSIPGVPAAGFKDVVVSVKRISKDCASLTLLAESLDAAGTPQHAARLITNRGIV